MLCTKKGRIPICKVWPIESQSQRNHFSRQDFGMSMESILQRVSDCDNVCTFSMRELRDAIGRQRCKGQVCQEISDALFENNLRHLPLELPHDQNHKVRVYRIGTPVAEVIGLVSRCTENSDEALRTMAELYSVFVVG